ncbi:hypothetical protein GMORB2_4891 [Geosmithia morbida]|uniref:Uncharacterized protein n=1 Tax=Geosmithia morbida TaxID=1094350 RepID=A0A9P5CYG7_9HYPO|nr:uncharacterized protein GMORB2_4891 [Geosmithia morbida]KAF4119372.1 hypothetical protein GMORB2_4891 [Geosmithia morbida]
MNQIQVVGSHNSYHIESDLEERDAQQKLLKNTVNYWYSHTQLDLQLGEQQMRNLEIDVLADPKGGNYAEPLVRSMSGLPYPTDPAWKEPGVKVLHVPGADVHTQCVTLISCLGIIKSWMDAHPLAVPIPIMMELKVADAELGSRPYAWDRDGGALLDELDDEIRSVFGEDQLLTPDSLRQTGRTLEQSVLERGWPDLDSARGRIFFLMDNGPDHVYRHAYKKGRPSLQGRLNSPTSDEENANIRKQVAANYWVRTRADEPMGTIIGKNCSTEQREAAFRSGAQIVSTDFQAYGMSSRWGCEYACRLDRRRAARCNPVNAPRWCTDWTGLEPIEYRLGLDQEL